MTDRLAELKIMEDDARLRYIPVILGDSKDVLLAEIVKAKPRRILEIGTAIGYSGILMLDNCDATLDTIELDELRFNEAKDNFAKYGLTDRVNQYLGDATEMLTALRDNEYDFVFIDGPKSKYLAHYDTIIDSVPTGGIIFADNVLFRGMVRSAEYPERKHRSIVLKLRDYLDRITHDDNVSTVILEVGDGIAITTKRR